MSKPKVIKDYDKLDESFKTQLKRAYPHGFAQGIVKFRNQHGHLVSAVPFDTEDRTYLIRMTVSEARAIIADDDDYDEYGMLKTPPQNIYESKLLDDLAPDAENAPDPTPEQEE